MPTHCRNHDRQDGAAAETIALRAFDLSRASVPSLVFTLREARADQRGVRPAAWHAGTGRVLSPDPPVMVWILARRSARMPF